MKIVRGVNDLNVVGADIVEVAPAYDSGGGDTAFIVSSHTPEKSNRLELDTDDTTGCELSL